jgi:hypothetical protein
MILLAISLLWSNFDVKGKFRLTILIHGNTGRFAVSYGIDSAPVEQFLSPDRARRLRRRPPVRRAPNSSDLT